MRTYRLLTAASALTLAVPAGAQVTSAPAPQPAAAPSTDTLREAMVRAYNTNPTIAAERANLRATDENVPIARAPGLPAINATGSYSESVYDTSGRIGLSTAPRTINGGLEASIPIYSGGSVRNAVRAEKVRVEAGRETLRAAEATLFTDVVVAYMNVIRDESVVRLNQQNVRALGVNFQASRDRFEVGDLTRTDVAQSEARAALAQAQLEQAEAQLIGSRENYIRVIGVAPGVLAPPPPLPNLPTSPDQAVTVALDGNPNLAAAERLRDATRYDVNAAAGTRAPRISLGSTSSYFNNLNSLSSGTSTFIPTNDGIATTAGVQLTIPLYQGGLPSARVRQARARESQAMENVTATERSVISQVRSAYATYQASLRVIASARSAVSANRLSLEGVRAENSVGTRTIIEILNAEQEFLNAQVTLVTAERDAYVAGFAVLAAMGKAEAQDLGLDGGPLYDPLLNYNRAKNSYFDWNDGSEPKPQATRTNNTPAQTPVVHGPIDPEFQRPVDSTAVNTTGVNRNR